MSNDQEDMMEKLSDLIERHKQLEKELESTDMFLRQVSSNLVNIVEEIDKSLVELEERSKNLEQEVFAQPSQPSPPPEQAQPSQPSPPPEQAQPSQPSPPPASQASPGETSEGAPSGPPGGGGGRGKLIMQLERALAKRKRRRKDRGEK